MCLPHGYSGASDSRPKCDNLKMSADLSIQGFLEFSGKEIDQYGMPSPYRKYWIVASPGPVAGSGIATIMTLTRDTPTLDSENVLVHEGGPDGAFAEAVNRLGALPQNRGLEMRFLDRKPKA